MSTQSLVDHFRSVRPPLPYELRTASCRSRERARWAQSCLFQRTTSALAC